jgi:hypothetical protein
MKVKSERRKGIGDWIGEKGERETVEGEIGDRKRSKKRREGELEIG